MRIFEKLEEYRYEQVVFCHDKSTGLKAIICVHNTTLGPALGGCRMYPYASEDEAVVDALRLARGMTYKAAASGLNLGGGKSVIIGDPRKDKTEALFRSFGRYIETLGGRYITAEDVGTTTEDMVNIQLETSFVVGVDKTYGGSGDPSPFTALGVFQGMKACAEDKFGSTSLEGRTVAVQGLGHVGYYLCELLSEDGANLVVTDVRKENVDRVVSEFGAKAVEPDEILSVECDVFAPCALGGVLNDESIPNLKCEAIAGAANNVLLEPRHGESLAKRNILYAPDYVINAGGLINVADELEGYNSQRATRRVMGIRESVKRIIAISKRDGVPTHAAADTLALERIAEIGSMVRLHTGHPYGQLRRQRETL
ncbi:MAG: Glu/Leu/Phe/Val family dehydrogenase [Rubrobacteraceae bacterium]